MNLLYITNGVNGVGGLERVLSVKTKIFADNNYKVNILGLNKTDQNFFYEFSEQVCFHDIIVKGNPVIYIFRYISGVIKKIKEINPDIIIVCDDGLKAFIIPFITNKRIPVIYERHVSNNIFFNDNQSFLSKKLSSIKISTMKFLSRFFNAFVVLNEGNMSEWTYKENIKVIENILPFFPEKISRLENKIAIAVGKQSYQKNYERMIDIWKEVHKSFPEWILYIYGKKDETLKLQSQIDKHNLQDKVILKNPAKDIESKYLESSIFLMTSRYEGQPMVLIEAMSCGLPSVTFDFQHGPKEMITNGLNGFVVPYQDDDTFVKKIKELIKNEELRRGIGLNARKASENYSGEKIFKKWDNLFKELKTNV